MQGEQEGAGTGSALRPRSHLPAKGSGAQGLWAVCPGAPGPKNSPAAHWAQAGEALSPGGARWNRCCFKAGETPLAAAKREIPGVDTAGNLLHTVGKTALDEPQKWVRQERQTDRKTAREKGGKRKGGR